MAELYKSVTELMKTARGNKALGDALADITDFQQIIDDTPTADVVEVKRGKWLKKRNMYECSICTNTIFANGISGFNYCHGCGAKMDGGKAE